MHNYLISYQIFSIYLTFSGRCRLSLRQLFAPFIPLRGLKMCKGPRAQGPRETDLERRKPPRLMRKAGREVAAHGRPAELGVEVPAAAAYHAGWSALGYQPRPAVDRRPIVPIVIVVLHPLPDIAVHIVKPPGIGAFASNPLCCFTGIITIPGIFAKFAASSPNEYSVVVPARQAYSHSASLGSR